MGDAETSGIRGYQARQKRKRVEVNIKKIAGNIEVSTTVAHRNFEAQYSVIYEYTADVSRLIIECNEL